MQKPERLEANREAILILSLIAAIMVTDLVFDGFRFALFAGSDPGIAHERGFADCRFGAGVDVRRPPEGTLRAGWQLSYWLQMLTVFAFLVLLPVGEHFHIVTALPGLFFAHAGPPNRVPSVDLDRVMNAADGEDVTVGVRTARDLAWKDAYDAFTCTECGRCKTVLSHLSHRQAACAQVGERQPEEASGRAAREHIGRRCDARPCCPRSSVRSSAKTRCGRARPAAIAKRPARSSSSISASSSRCGSNA